MSTDIKDLLGQVIGNYRLTHLLGRGGMSAVFLGQPQNDAQPPVAIKLLLPSASFGPEERSFSKARFLREVRTITRLHHEHILPVLDYGKANEFLYMIMPLISRGTLAMQLIAEGRPLPFSEIAKDMTQIAGALDYAHQQGVIHRDIKPSNVLLDEQGKVYLTDFGIARLFDKDLNTTGQMPTSITMTGEMIGTPSYMAPELFLGEQAGPATDIYALGTMLYQLVTRRLPFKATHSLAIAMQHLHADPQPPRLLRPELPEAAEAAILRALAKDPSARFASAGALARAFEAGLRGEWTEGVSPQFISASQQQPAMAAMTSTISATPTRSTQVGPTQMTHPPSRSAKLMQAAPTVRMVVSAVLMVGILCLALLLSGKIGGWAIHPSLPIGGTPGTSSQTKPTTPHTTPGTTTSVAVKGSDVSALRSGNGATRWHFFTKGRVSQPAVVLNGVVYVGTDGGYVYALRSSDGTLLWASHPGSGVTSPMVVTDGVIYYSTVHYFVHALQLSNGHSIWSYHIGSPILSTLRVSNGILFAHTEDGSFYTLRATDGVPLALSQQSTLYAYANANMVYVLLATSQSPLWTFSTNGRVNQQPVVLNGVVYVGTDTNYVYALRAADGTLLWTYHAGSSVATPLTIVNGVLYFSSVHYYVHAVRLDNGTQLWTYHIPSPIISPTTIAKGVDYIYTRDGTVYMVQASSGNLLSITTALRW